MNSLRGAALTAVAGGILVLTGCHGAEDAADAHAASATAVAARTTAVGGTASDAPSTTTPPSPPTATPSSPDSADAPAPSATNRTTTRSTAPTARPGCRNLPVTTSVKTAVTAAYRRSYPRFVHVRPVAHHFFYGECGATRYAATSFEATAGATTEELVAMQDEGSATKYFRAVSGAGWGYLASDGFPQGPYGCGDIPQIPADLAKAWGDCSVG
ncbi:hypothetical protein [Streptomyces mangrovisoli]|uniref:Lipoprotein n=1 Tax=Streptomyces mangrovisoli TaxID=1428628 RepID=A0A1J4P3J2_9ACTN|nr:hypothetical protein [Streptomyces mangrovisoli]OIJ68324.1 hypothetical protein WN71_007830 [Streptomyces mangrovisoli]